MIALASFWGEMEGFLAVAIPYGTLKKTLSSVLQCQFFTMLAFLGACRPVQQQSSQSLEAASVASHLGAEAIKLWNFYEKSAVPQGYTMQPGCRPHHFKLPQGVKYRGLAIMIHGYTACPQQFFEWAQMLTAQGYEVLAPVLPGFGIDPVPATDPQWPEPVKDVVDLMPKAEDIIADPLNPQVSKYALLAEQMNAIASKVSGDRIIGGISAGGTVAAHAINLKPQLYSRALLLAPFFAVDIFAARQLADAINLSKWVDAKNPEFNTLAKMYALLDNNAFAKAYLILKESGIGDRILQARYSWGPGCYAERKGGRQGICDFLFSNLAAVEAFGLKVIDESHPISTKIQIVGVEDDKVASTGHMAQAAAKWLGQSSSSGGALDRSLQATAANRQVAACFFPTGANHSLLSRFDSPGENKFWLTDLLRDATRFVTHEDGFPYPDAHTESMVKPFHHCRLSR